MKPFIINTKSGNWYIYSPAISCVYPCNRILAFIVSLHLENINKSEWRSIIQEKYGSENNQEISYYIELFEFLRKTGYFNHVDLKTKIDFNLNESVIDYYLCNISQVSLEVTQKCNLQCTYCGYSELYDNYLERNNMEMSYLIASNILNYVFSKAKSRLRSSYNVPMSIILYGGEPLLNINLIKKVINLGKSLSSTKIPVSFTLITNGTLLNKHIQYLVQENFKIVISLDGNYLHSGHRLSKNKKNIHKLVEKNILLIKDNYPDFYLNNVSFNAVLHNLNPINDVINYYSNKFHKIPSLSTIATNGIVEKRKDKFNQINNTNNYVSCRNWDTAFPQLPDQSNLIDIIHRTTPFVFHDYNDLIYQDIRRERYPTATCLPFSVKLFVTANGELLPCEQVSHAYTLGNVDNHGVNLKLDTIAKNYNNYFQEITHQCSSCWKIFHCSECLLKLSENGYEFHCNQKLDQKGFEQYLLSSMELLEEHPETYNRVMKDVFYMRG